MAFVENVSSTTHSVSMVREILPDGSVQALNLPADVNNRFFGFNGKYGCSIGRLSLIVRSKVDPKFDLAYIDITPDIWKVGLLSELRPFLKGYAPDCRTYPK